MPISNACSISWTIAVMWLLALSGCGPDPISTPVALSEEAKEFAKSVCGARQSCGCSDARFESAERCESDLAAAFDAAVAKGLVLDKECFASTLAVMEGCPTWPPAELPCTALRGTKAAGEACDAYFELLPVWASDCEDGLNCYGTCEPEYVFEGPLEIGDRCRKDVGCGSSNLYCGGDGRCHLHRVEGQTCDDYDACEPPSYCEGLGTKSTGTCVAKVMPGGACQPNDWHACRKTDDEVHWCSPDTSTCEAGPPEVCLLTHPAVLTR